MGLIRLAVADAAITFLWVVYIILMMPLMDIILGTLTLQGYGFPVMMALIAGNILIFNSLSDALDGASWDPSPVLAFYSSSCNQWSYSGCSIYEMLTLQSRVVCGAIRGVEKVSGPHLLVEPNRGILCELILTFMVTFFYLIAILKGPKRKLFKNLIIILASNLAMILGAGYTGPALNPAYAFAWAYIDGKHSELENLLVYCLAPLVGSFFAAGMFQFLFTMGRQKEKAA
ncbi:hypothetical protein KP509_36G000800 [Ceratopteris richardii]|uniref:Uncharacterized protein n=1 Tax=Ceratopteris richardii TaxID=49495 RepID=A0A8T2QA26_CERRI|nr:hypothetical protein KP509_36G000800 [Ceratopteris richardii]